MMGIRMTNTERSGSPVADPEISELVEDLAVIEVKKGATFAFPEFLPRHWDRVWARTIRRILEGGCAALPNPGGRPDDLAEANPSAAEESRFN
jgi:hypothetical protein